MGNDGGNVTDFKVGTIDSFSVWVILGVAFIGVPVWLYVLRSRAGRDTPSNDRPGSI